MVLGAQAPGRVGRRPFSFEEPREGLFLVDPEHARRRRNGMRLVAVTMLVLVLAAPARAGGDFVDLTSGVETMWLVGAFGVRELDAHTGRTLAAPRPTPAAYPLSVAVWGGAAWIASVENGYVDGRVSRFDLASRRTSSQSLGGPVEYLATGAGGVYALVAPDTVVLLGRSGSVLRRWAVPGAGRLAADQSGCWVSTSGRLVHIDASGHEHLALRAGLGDVATGDGAAWLPRATSILRIDELTGRVRTLRTGRLRLGGFQHDVAFGDGALWTLDTRAPALQRRDPRTGRLLASVSLPAIPDALVAVGTGVWVGIAGLRHEALRFDPRTLRRTLRVRLV
jgi:hypothetical protein